MRDWMKYGYSLGDTRSKAQDRQEGRDGQERQIVEIYPESEVMDEYCRGCRFLVMDGAVCHCLKDWPEFPCDQKEPGRPTKKEIARAIDEGIIPMEARP